MKIKSHSLRLILLFSLGGSLFFCIQAPDPNEDISIEKIENTIQRFTVHRLRLHLHSNGPPPGNEEILRQSAIENGLNPALLLRKVKDKRPKLYNSLFKP